MTQAEYKTVIITELDLASETSISALIDVYWGLCGNAVDDFQRFLIVKKAILNSLLTKARNKVDVTIGFDTIKSSQTIKNLTIAIEQIDKQLEEFYPGYHSYVIASTRSTPAVYFNDDEIGDCIG